MKSAILFTLVALALFVSYAEADCEDAAAKNTDDGEVTSWFKNLGCQIKKGAGDLQETAKPWADKIGSTAKEFGSSVAQKYDEIKHKLTDDDGNTNGAAANAAHVVNAPTEKVPLAPLSGEASAPSNALNGAPTAK